MKKKINLLMIFMVLILSVSAFGLTPKAEDGIAREWGGITVDWEHTLNSRDRQEYIVTINSAVGNIVEPSLILSEYTNGYSDLDIGDVRLYLYEETLSTVQRTEWCEFSNLSSCGDTQTENRTFENTYSVDVVDVDETLIETHLLRNSDYFEVGVDALQHTGANKERKYKVVLDPVNDFNEGDYGVFSLRVDNFEFWDKTHSSDFFISGQEAYWKFDGNGLDATDNDNDLVLNGITSVTGVVNTGYDYEGLVGDYAVLQQNNLFSTNSIGTIDMWIKTNSNTNYPTLFESADIGVNKYFIFNLEDGTGKLRLIVNDGTGQSTTLSTNSVSDGNWHYVVLSSIGSSYEMWIDGVNETLTGDNDGMWFNSVTDREHIVIGKSLRFNNYFFDGIIDEVGIWNDYLRQEDIDFRYNGGTPTTDQQYPYILPSVGYNTSLQAFHDELGDLSINSNTYANVYSFNYTIGTNDTDLVMLIPFTATKTSGSQSNDLYFRTIIDGVPSQEKLVVTVPENGDSRSGVYNSVAELFIEGGDGFHEIEIEVRRTGNGAIDMVDPHINVYSDLTANGKLNNAYINISSVDVTASGTYTDALTGSLLNASSGNTLLMFVGSIYNSSGDNNDVDLRFAGDTLTNGALLRTIDIDETGNVFMTKMFYNSDENFTVEARSDFDFTLDGNFYVVDLLDTDGGIVQTYQNFTTGTQTNELSLNGIIALNESLITMSSVSFNPSTLGTASYNVNLDDVNATLSYQSETVTRSFDAGDYGVLGIFHGYENLTIGNTLNLETDFNYSGTGTFQYFNILAMQSTSLDVGVDTTGDINLTINQANGSVLSSVTGSCDSKNVINSITSNSTDWVFSGDADSFTFSYTGEDVSNTTVSFTCTDQYANSETVTRYYTIDATLPSCTGIQDVFLTLDIQTENNTGYTWDVTCSDNLGLNSLSVVCDNGFTSFDSISGSVFNFTDTITLNETTQCSYNITDISSNLVTYSNTFNVDVQGIPPDYGQKIDWNIPNPTPELFECPTNGMQMFIVIFFFVISLFGVWVSFVAKNPFFMLLGCVMWIYNSLYLWGCAEVLSIALMMIGVAGIVLSLNAKIYPSD